MLRFFHLRASYITNLNINHTNKAIMINSADIFNINLNNVFESLLILIKVVL